MRGRMHAVRCCVLHLHRAVAALAQKLHDLELPVPLLVRHGCCCSCPCCRRLAARSRRTSGAQGLLLLLLPAEGLGGCPPPAWKARGRVALRHRPRVPAARGHKTAAAPVGALKVPCKWWVRVTWWGTAGHEWPSCTVCSAGVQPTAARRTWLAAFPCPAWCACMPREGDGGRQCVWFELSRHPAQLYGHTPPTVSGERPPSR